MGALVSTEVCDEFERNTRLQLVDAISKKKVCNLDREGQRDETNCPDATYKCIDLWNLRERHKWYSSHEINANNPCQQYIQIEPCEQTNPTMNIPVCLQKPLLGFCQKEGPADHGQSRVQTGDVAHLSDQINKNKQHHDKESKLLQIQLFAVYGAIGLLLLLIWWSRQPSSSSPPVKPIKVKSTARPRVY
jgi:hypothetical protein